METSLEEGATNCSNMLQLGKKENIHFCMERILEISVVEPGGINMALFHSQFPILQILTT